MGGAGVRERGSMRGVRLRAVGGWRLSRENVRVACVRLRCQASAHVEDLATAVGSVHCTTAAAGWEGRPATAHGAWVPLPPPQPLSGSAC